MDEDREGPPPREDAARLGLRCAWCGKILRDPVGFPRDDELLTPTNALAWSHGMCADCQKRFQDGD